MGKCCLLPVIARGGGKEAVLAFLCALSPLPLLGPDVEEHTDIVRGIGTRATIKVRKLLQGIISVGIVWATLAAFGVLAIVVSALPAQSFQQEASNSPVRVQEPPQVPGVKSALSAGAMALPEVASLNTVDPPSVNGLFYGDGDDSRYNLYAENPGRSKLYYYLDGTTLYAALVLSSSVNDNVFGVKKCNPVLLEPMGL